MFPYSKASRKLHTKPFYLVNLVFHTACYHTVDETLEESLFLPRIGNSVSWQAFQRGNFKKYYFET